MCITIEKEDPEFFANTGEYENCVFCDCPTEYWVIKHNRPVCPICSKLYNDSDLQNAPFNY